MHDVAVVQYENPLESLRRAVDLAGGFGRLSADAKVFIKPNVCVWHEGINFPKWGVLTTARLVEDTVVLLKEAGAEDITILEGVTENERGSVPLFELAAKAKVACVVAPAGSKRDMEVVSAANKLKLPLIFAPNRHFLH